MRNLFKLGGGLAVLAAGFVLAGCGSGGSTEGKTPESSGSDLTGKVVIDGSTTVFPITQAMAEDFQAANSGIEISVSSSGTGSGIKKFIAGEIDIAGASRPIKEDEDKQLKEKGIEYIEVPIAYDGLSIVVNPKNTWVLDMSVEDLKKVWAPGSSVKSWKDINPAWPDNTITFHGPSDNHGTYEYFTEAIVGKKNDIRADYRPNQEYTTVIQSVAGDENAIGYVGFNYFAENQGQVKAITVGGVAPSAETIEGGQYVPLSRPLFIYVSKKAMDEKPAVKAFVEYALGKGIGTVSEARYVPLPEDAYNAIRARVTSGKTGSVFMNVAPGLTLSQVLAKENG